MPIEHAYQSATPNNPAHEISSDRWNEAHAVDITNADVNAAAAIVESKLSLNFATHAAVTLGTANGLSLAAQALSLGLASAGVTGALSGADWSTFNSKQAALTLPLAASQGGTGIANGASATLALPNAATTITGGGTVALGGFTLTVPATGTAALLATANVFTQNLRITKDTPAIRLTNTGSGTGDFSFKIDSTTGMWSVIDNDTGLEPFGIRKGQAANLIIMRNSCVGFRQTNPTSLVQVTGQADITQLHVTGFTTQTNTVSQILRNDGATATAGTTLTIGANSTGTPGAGFGVRQLFTLESSTTADQSAAQIDVSWATATHASRKARLTLNVYDTAVREAIRIEASGTAAMIGLYGVTAIVRPVTTDAAATFVANTSGIADDTATFDGYTLGTIVKALRNLGILT